MAFGQLLKDARKAAEKKLREVSEVSGLAVSVISDIEHGRRKPPELATVAKIEKFLGVGHKALTRAAEKESNLKNEMRELINKRLQLNYALLRAADGLTDKEVNKMIEDMQSKWKKEGTEDD